LSDPWVADNIDNVGAHVRVGLEHVSDQVLELLRVEAWLLTLGVSSPEHLGFVLFKELEVLIIIVGHAERRVTRVKDEEDDTKGEKIDHIALVGLVREDLRCHVSWSTNS